jgi:hypothetical protein
MVRPPGSRRKPGDRHPRLSFAVSSTEGNGNSSRNSVVVKTRPETAEEAANVDSGISAHDHPAMEWPSLAPIAAVVGGACTRRGQLGLLLLSAIVLGACARRPPRSATPRPTTPLIEQTTVAKHRCARADGEVRPFVVEWDATDLSDFEAHAARDIVFVKYEACGLELLTGCADQSLRGKHGAYHAPRWTSGGVESFSIEDESDLYTKLPLGVVSLSGRVQRGEKLELLYHVSGVASATRDSVHRREISDNPRCQAATHFVHAYNVGAFALETASKRREAGSADVAVAGAGAGHRSQMQVLKRAGVLESCRGQSASDTLTCRVPIRLHLRRLADGEPSDPTSSQTSASPGERPAPTMQSMLDAGKLRNAAVQKLVKGDGTGCLRDLERAREIDPDTDHIQGQLWAQCTMRAGKCEAGKQLLRRYYETEAGMPADAIDRIVQSQEKAHCTP